MELITAFFKTAKYPPAAPSGGIKIVHYVFQRSEPTCVFYLSLVAIYSNRASLIREFERIAHQE